MSGPVVTISRQHGSGGEDVGRLIAERLGVPFLDEEIRQRAAARCGVSERALAEVERPQSFVTRMLERLGSVGIMADGGAVETVTSMPIPTSESIRAVLDEVVREAAEDGAVIMGYAAHLTLRDHPGVLRVFVEAPLEARIARLVHDEEVSPAQAQRQIETLDRERVRFYQDTYHVNWYDLRLYDCVVDTHLLGITGAADIVLEMAERVCLARPEAAAPAVAEPAATVEEILEEAPAKPEGQVVQLREGEVCLRPMAAGDSPALLEMFRSLPPEELLFLRRDVTDPLVVEALERDVLDGRAFTLLAETVVGEGESPIVVGEATLRRSEVPWTSHVGELRAIVAPSHRGRGLGERLVTETLRAAADAGLEKVTAETLDTQVGARRVLSRLGFVEEGRFAGYACDLNGEAHDLIVMTYTRPPRSDNEE